MFFGTGQHQSPLLCVLQQLINVGFDAGWCGHGRVVASIGCKALNSKDLYVRLIE